MRIWTPEIGWKPPYGAVINPRHHFARGLKWSWLFNEGGRRILTHTPAGPIGLTADTTGTWFTWGNGIMGPEMVMATTGLPKATGVGAHGTDKISVVGIFRIIAISSYRNWLLTSSDESTGLRLSFPSSNWKLCSTVSGVDTEDSTTQSYSAGDTVFLGFTFDGTADIRKWYSYRYTGAYANLYEVITGASDTRSLTAGTNGTVFIASAAIDTYALNGGHIITSVWDGRILTEEEMKYLIWNPFCFFAPVQTARHYKVPAAGGGVGARIFTEQSPIFGGMVLA